MVLASMWALSAQEVTLKEADIVSVTVFDEESISGAFPVGPDGRVVMPLLGGITAIGRSPKDLAGEIESKLEKDYIRDAQVVVALAKESELPPQFITVIGQVAAPGRVPFEAGTSIDLFTAVASSGGLTERGNRHRIELKRRSGSDLTTRILSLESDRVYPLREGDTIIIHALEEVEEKIATLTVIGQVQNPGAIEMDPDDPYDILTGIAIAGGFTTIANPSKVVVRRLEDGRVKTFEVNVRKMQRDQTAPFMLRENDTVFVSESIF